MTKEATEVLSTPSYPALVSGPLLALFLILASLILWWLWKRRGLAGLNTASDLQIRVATTRPLGPRAHLAIVEAGGTRSLIATTQQGVHFLRDLPMDVAKGVPVFEDHLDRPGEATPQ